MNAKKQAKARDEAVASIHRRAAFSPVALNLLLRGQATRRRQLKATPATPKAPRPKRTDRDHMIDRAALSGELLPLPGREPPKDYPLR
jgi:hypothetical protein